MFRIAILVNDLFNTHIMDRLGQRSILMTELGLFWERLGNQATEVPKKEPLPYIHSANLYRSLSTVRSDRLANFIYDVC